MTQKLLTNFKESHEFLESLVRLYLRTGREDVMKLVNDAIATHMIHVDALRKMKSNDIAPMPTIAREKNQRRWSHPPEAAKAVAEDPWGFLNIRSRGKRQPLPRFVPIKK